MYSGLSGGVVAGDSECAKGWRGVSIICLYKGGVSVGGHMRA